MAGTDGQHQCSQIKSLFSHEDIWAPMGTPGQVSQALVPPSGARRARCLLALLLVALGDSVCPWYPIRKKEILEEAGELVSPKGSQCRPPW